MPDFVPEAIPTKPDGPSSPLYIPPVLPRAPLCPLCDQEVFSDDGFWLCSSCEVCWRIGDGEPGQPVDEDAYEICGAEIAPWADEFKYPHIASHRFRCVHKAGHTSDWPGSLFFSNGLDYHLGVRTDVTDPALYDCHRWAVGK